MLQKAVLDFIKSNYTSLYFLVMTILYWIDSIVLNPIVILSFSILIYQLVVKNNKIGIYYAIIVFLITFYLTFAFLSDFHKITTFDDKAINFMSIGILLLLSNYIMSVLMLIKYVIIENVKTE